MMQRLRRRVAALVAEWRRGFEYVRERFGPARRLVIVHGDSLPERMPSRDLVLARDGSEDWCMGMKCPCGCGRTIELLVFPEAKPRWSLKVDRRRRPSLTPSVWLQTGCRSHFWVRNGRVHWSR
ncbi:DUF6527 family protein [Mesorhizobium sp. LNHC252B00]|uniref:DUF6527 family protein n=2 Tax=Mesorhizobium TaxID=68287 RepID=UPI00269A710C